MPQNPRETNFWTLLAQYSGDVPPEVYGYVFFIVSAAVIGENPRFFGFEFDNPLAFYIVTLTSSAARMISRQRHQRQGLAVIPGQ